MFPTLLTTIISYTTNIHNVNKEYHNTFRYSNESASLYVDRLIAYNWRDMHNTGTIIYKGPIATKYVLSANY